MIEVEETHFEDPLTVEEDALSQKPWKLSS